MELGCDAQVFSSSEASSNLVTGVTRYLYTVPLLLDSDVLRLEISPSPVATWL